MSQPDAPVPLHFDCVVCQARATATDPGEASMTLLVMLHADVPLQQITADLCFEHRRQVEAAARRMRAS